MYEPKAGSVIDGKYELIEEIGRGGMGYVWRAHLRTLDIACAVKFIKESYADEPTIRTRFIREARAAAKLQSPNTVSILDVGEWEECPFMAMELLRGETLEERLQRDGVLDPRLTCDIVDQVARGLHKAHQAWLVHRDLKPENIFLVDEKPLLVKILDFGIAKQLGGTTDVKTLTGMVVGTPHYMSPEQAAGDKAIDYRSDLWSLAVVAFQCLTGRRPFEGTGLGDLFAKILTGEIPSPRSFDSKLPAAVDGWWNEVANREPAQRPDSALSVAQGLREALGLTSGVIEGTAVAPTVAVGAVQAVSGAGTLKPVTRPPPETRGPRSVQLGGLIVAACLGLGVAGYALFSGSAASDVDEPAAELDSESSLEPSTEPARPAVQPILEPAASPSQSDSSSQQSDPSGQSESVSAPGTPPAPSASVAPARKAAPQPSAAKVSPPPAGAVKSGAQPARKTPPASPVPKKKTLDERLGF